MLTEKLSDTFFNNIIYIMEAEYENIYEHSPKKARKERLEDIDIFSSPSNSLNNFKLEKKKVFQISNYNFLKKKRELIKEQVD
jgi:flagellar biosynthesis protein FliP